MVPRPFRQALSPRAASRRLTRAALALLAASALALAGLASLHDREPPPEQQPAALRVVQEGVSVELAAFAVAPDRRDRPLRSGDEATFRFTLTDASSGVPLESRYPAAWVNPRPQGDDGAATGCAERANEIMNGGFARRAEIDLNTYRVLVLQDDATLSIIDPRFSFGGSRLLSMISLKSPGADWALTADQSRLFVSLPDVDRVAVVAPEASAVTAEVEAGPRPGRVALQPDEGYLWVASGEGAPAEGAGTVTVIAVPDLRVAARLRVGRGRHDLAFSDDSRTAFVTNQDDGTVSVIDVGRLAVVRELPAGGAPTKIAFSRLAQAAYVTDAAEGRVTVIDGARREVVARIDTEPGLAGIAFEPKGRYGVAWNAERDTVSVIDTAEQRIVQTGQVEKGPDQVVFSDRLAYIRHRGSDTVLMIPLERLGERGQPIPVADFTGGQSPPGAVSLGASIVQAPGEPAVLVANAADKVIYYYREGMAAPAGSFSTHGRVPKAIQVLNHGLRPRGKGVYETTAALKRAGPYEVIFLLDAPRVVHCFPLDVAEDPERPRQARTHVEALLPDPTVVAGAPVHLRLRLSDAETLAPRSGLADVRVLVNLLPGTWHDRPWARPEEEDGVYAIDFTPPSPGTYQLLVEARSIGLSFNTSPQVVLTAERGGEGRSP
ncbi:YncE family protein [Sorangium sp. So ce321]|uniref:YncE family protein n=1 Tax=Sorangium sp. So ce321 TaxID=3133300 RepID=UPI003F6048EE